MGVRGDWSTCADEADHKEKNDMLIYAMLIQMPYRLVGGAK